MSRQTLAFACAAAAVLGTLATKSPALAQGEPTSEWLTLERGPGAESCPDREAFEKMVEDRLQSDTPVSLAPGTRVAVRIDRRQQAGSAWQAEIHLLDSGNTSHGSRAISRDEESCAAVANASALIAALLLANPPAVETQSEARPAEPADAVPVPPSKPEPSRASVWTIAPELRALGSLGLLPGLGIGGQLSLAVRAPRWPELRASLARWLETQIAISDGLDVKLDLWRVDVGASAFSWQVGPVEAAAAVGVGAGHMTAQGSGYPGARLTSRWLFDLEAGAWVRARLTRGLFLVVSADLVFALLRARVAYTEADGASGEAFRASPVGGLFGLGLGYLFSS